MNAHTPGPWRTGSLISYNGTTGEPEAFVYRLRPDHPEETAHNRICIRGSETVMDCDADAALIAAAPDLLHACKMVMEMAISWQPLTPGDISEVKAAIAKAEGK